MTTIKNKSVPRFPSVSMFPEDKENQKIIEEFWRKIDGRRYSFAAVTRKLWATEADRIKSL